MNQSKIDKHTQFLLEETIRFFLENKMHDMGFNPYKTSNFQEELKKVIDEVKRLFNIIIDEELEKYEAQFTEVRNFCETNGIVKLNHDQ